MTTLTLKSPLPHQTFSTSGNRTFTADENGHIKDVPAGSQIYRDLIAMGCHIAMTDHIAAAIATELDLRGYNPLPGSQRAKEAAATASPQG